MKKTFTLILLAILFYLSAAVNNLQAQQWDTLSPIPESFTFPVVAVVNGKIHIMGGGGTGFTGKLVQQQMTTVHNEKSMELDIPTFLPGLYLIKIRPMSSNQFFAGVIEVTKT